MFSIFSGGIRPAQRKKATAQLPFRPMEQPPAQVVLPLAGVGTSAAVPLVTPGDRVRVGQKLADAIPGLAAVHASVSGTVAAVEPRQQLRGGTVLSVVIDSDGKDTPVASPAWRRVDKDASPASLRPGELADIAAQAGLTAMDGTGRPLSQLLRDAHGQGGRPAHRRHRVRVLRHLPPPSHGRPARGGAGRRAAADAGPQPARAVLALEGSQYDARGRPPGLPAPAGRGHRAAAPPQPLPPALDFPAGGPGPVYRLRRPPLCGRRCTTERP